MKRRLRRVVNFFAFNLLFFALYLNFIHKDNPSVLGSDASRSSDEVSVSAKKQETVSQKAAIATSVVNVSVK
jgi:hypothetical protein